MKKFVYLLASLMCVFGLSSCGGNNPVPSPTNYSVAFDGTKCSLYDGDEKIIKKEYLKGTKLNFRLKLDSEEVKLPDTISIISTDTCQPYSDYNYISSTGELTINNIDTNIEITAIASQKSSFDVSFSGSNCSLYDGDKKIIEEQYLEGTKLNLFLRVESDDFKLPDKISIINSDTQEAYSGFTYIKSTGNLTINNIDANIKITADADKYYKVNFSGSFCSLYDDDKKITDEEYLEKTKLDLILKVDSTIYDLPETINIINADTEADYSGYTYSKDSGEIIINSIDANIKIVANATKKITCKVKFEGFNCSLFDGEEKVIEKEYVAESSLSLIIKSDSEDFNLPTFINVVNSSNGEEYTDYVYNPDDGSFTLSKLDIDIEIDAFSYTNDIFEPLCLTSTQDGSLGLMCFKSEDTTAVYPKLNLQYKVDDGSWTDVSIPDDISNEQKIIIIPEVVKNQKIYLRGENPDGFSHYTSDSDYLRYSFLSNFYCNLSGNIMSLITKENFAYSDEIPNDYCFTSLFSEFETSKYGFERLRIENSESLALPATKLKTGSYYYMFYRNDYMKTAPRLLPAYEVASNAYFSMFYHNFYMTKTPYIFGKIIKDNGMLAMFEDCRALFEICDLNFYRCGSNGVGFMFYDCIALTKAPTIPNIPINYLGSNAFHMMFMNCSQLNIKVDSGDYLVLDTNDLTKEDISAYYGSIFSNISVSVDVEPNHLYYC